MFKRGVVKNGDSVLFIDSFWYRDNMLASVLLQVLFCNAQAQEPSKEVPHLKFTRKFLKDLKPDLNKFQRQPMVVKFGPNPVCYADSITVWNEILPEVYPQLKERGLDQWLGGIPPQPGHYAKAIEAENNFKQIISLHELQPGDFIAIRYDKEKDSGHLMMVNAVPKRHQANAPFLDESFQWLVEIIDLTSEPHGEGDPRYRKGGKHEGGFAKANFRFYVDGYGRPLGYTWTPGSRSKLYFRSEREIVFGRLKLAPPPGPSR